ncbi:MBL fold metallo-hydrolase [Frisingicoccus sp.]|uniref:MBL fold metallo-hydrolase n=1 Tax=Frisingicoccus sp. TaxID=1918627 RepID=UPI003AB33085
MGEYFKVFQLAENVYHIYEPGGVGSSLIVGRRQAMLIDTGYGFADISAVVRKITDLPLRVVNTHGHTDHAGGNRFFNKVWMNPADKATYKDYQKHQKPLVAALFESKRKAAGKGPIWPEDFDRMAWYEAGTKEFCWLINGQTFDLDAPEERCNQTFDFEEASEENHLIEAIFMPGHTVGSVMFFDWKNHILFPGDDLDYSLWMQFDTSAPLYTYKKRLKQLEQYPIEAILPSHKKQLLSTWILKRMPEAIEHLSLEKSRRFFHPRTGQPGWLYKEPLNGESPDGQDTIYITYQINNM